MDISITTSKCYNKKEGKINVKKGNYYDENSTKEAKPAI